MKSKTMTRKRILSMIIAISMLLSFIGTTNVFAIDSTSSELPAARGSVGLDFLGVTTNTGSPSTTAQPLPDVSELTAGKVVWVGLYISNMKQASEQISELKLYDDTLGYGGIYNLTASIEYDTSVFTAYTAGLNNMKTYLSNMDFWKDQYVTNQQDVTDFGDPAIYATKASAYSTMTATNSTAPKESTTGREPATIDTGKINTIKFTLTSGDNTPRASRVFSSASELSNDKLYIGIAALRVKNGATFNQGDVSAAAGLNAAEFQISTGDGPSKQVWTAAWHSDRSNTAYANLKNYLDYQGDMYMVPPDRTITYDLNTGANSHGTWKSTVSGAVTETVQQGSSPTHIADTYDVNVASLIDFDDGWGLEGWYLDSACTQPFDASYVVKADQTVYAKYKEGYTATFNLNADDAKFVDSTGTLPDTTDPQTIDKDKDQYYLGTGETITSQIKNYVPTRTGYTFKGWFTKNGTSYDKQYTDDTTVDTTATDLHTVQNQSLDLYAMWQKNGTDYTLTFDKNTTDVDSTDASPATVGFSATDTLNDVLGGFPVPPTKTGYTFKGWYKDAACTGDALTLTDALDTYHGAAEDFTVYAKWEYDDPATGVKVSFNANGGSFTSTPSDIIIPVGGTIASLPSASTMTAPANKAFAGWYTQESGTNNLTTLIKEGAAGTGTAIVTTLDGYDATPDPDEITLYAKWADKFTIEYNNNNIPSAAGAAMPDADTNLYGPEDDFTPVAYPAITDANYEITGWNTKPDGSGTTYTAGTSGKLPNATDLAALLDGTKLPLYAMWTYKGADGVTVTFDGNDSATNKATLTPNNGTSNENKYTLTMTLPPNYTISESMMPTATRTKYNFNHWNTSQAVSPLDPVTQPTITTPASTGSPQTMNVYAIWKANTDEKIVTFYKADPTDADEDTQSGKKTKAYEISIASGDTLNALPAGPTGITGYAFEKWVTTYKGTTEYTAPQTISDNTEVYASYANEYTIVYDLSGIPAGAGFTTPTDSNKYRSTDTFTAAGFTSAQNPSNDYLIKGWNTEKDGTGTSFALAAASQTLPTAEAVNGTITLYPVWEYQGSDAVTVIYDGNGTTEKAATVTPNDGGTVTDKYTIKRKAGYVIPADEMPKATRTDYEFNTWATTKTAAAGSQASITVGSDTTKPFEIYATWTPESSKKITITFNGNKPANTSNLQGMPDPTTIDIASGDSLGNLFPTGTPTVKSDNAGENWGFKGWYDAASAGNEVKSTTTFSANTDVYAQWEDPITLKFDANGGSNVSKAEIKIKTGETIATNSVAEAEGGSTSLPTVDAPNSNYTFDGWGYVEDGELKKIAVDTVITKSLTLKAVWKVKVYVAFEENAFDYDGNVHTPFSIQEDGTTKNFSVHLTDGADIVTGADARDFTDDFEPTYFDVKYEKEGTAVTNPTDVGTYDVTSVALNATGTKQVGTKYLVIEQIDSANEFDINAQEVNYKISRNYQYLNPAAADGKPSGTANMKIEVVGTAPSGLVYDVIGTSATDPDIKVTFIDKNDPSKTFENTMPTAFGEYIVKFEPTDGSNFSVGTVLNTPLTTEKSSDQFVSWEGDPAPAASLFIVPKTRVVKVDFGTGSLTTAGQTKYGTADTNGRYKLKEVTLTNKAEDEVIEHLSDIKTALSSQTPAVALPVSPSEYLPPTGQRIPLTGEKFETRTDTEDTETYPDGYIPTDFKVTDDILASGEELVIYAKYEAAEWTIEFVDTKATPEDSLKFTVGANSGIAYGKDPTETDAAKGTQKIEQQTSGTWNEITATYTADKAKTDLPTPSTAPTNAKFLGWTTEQTLATATPLKTEAALTDAEKKTIVAVTDYPGNTDPDAAARIAATDTSKTVYALYVMSDDATLKTVEFNEYKDGAKGDAASYVNGDYSTPGTAITFDPEKDEYTLIITNGNDLYGLFQPSQPGSAITVTKGVNNDIKTDDTSDDTVKTAAADVTVTTPTGATDGSKEFSGEATEATTYDDTTGNTYNQFTVTVTAPDGTTTKTYKFNVLEYAKPEIKLNYGNSPVGEIMKDATLSDADKEAAINSFKTSRIFSGVETNLPYYEKAWDSYVAGKKDMDNVDFAVDENGDPINYNGDDDPTSIFIYQRKAFVDPGFTATDRMNKPVADTNVSVSLKMISVNDGFITYSSTDNPQTQTAGIETPITGTNHVFDEFVNYNIRPDVYTMTYTFTDNGTTVTAKRKVISVIQNGDVMVNAMNVVNSQDANNVEGHSADFENIAVVNSLYKFRVADTYLNDMLVINSQDANQIRAANDAPVHVFYNALPTN